jgi:hypothetical protein
MVKIKEKMQFTAQIFSRMVYWKFNIFSTFYKKNEYKRTDDRIKSLINFNKIITKYKIYKQHKMYYISYQNFPHIPLYLKFPKNESIL